MFSGNHAISTRQLYRNYAAALISLAALLPPLVMDRNSGGSILTALALLGLFLAGTVLARRPEQKAVRWLCYAHYWVLGTMLVHMTGLLIHQFLLTSTSPVIIMAWFYLFCYYNLYKGLECRVRVSEILFPFFLLFLILLSALMYGEIEPGRLRDLRISFDRGNVAVGYELFCWLGAVQGLWHLHGSTDHAEKYPRAVFWIWLTGAAASVGFALFSYCIYGNAGHTGLVYPMASAMTLAHLPGNVIGRLDALFLFAWVIGLFLLCSSLFAPLTDGEPDTRRKWLLAALMAASFGAACVPECMEWGQKLLYYVTTPVQILLLLLHLALSGRKGKRLAAGAACLLLPLCLTGCSSQELEQQSLVTAVGVDAGEEKALHLTFGFGTADEEGEEPFETESDSLQEAKEQYWERFQKNMDFNHLKNFYFSEGEIRQEAFLELLEEIQVNGAYSRGTLVHVTEGPAGEQAEKEDQPEEGMPVHRLLNARYNEECCEIPRITEDGRYKGSVSWP